MLNGNAPDRNVEDGTQQQGSAHRQPTNGPRQHIIERRDRAAFALSSFTATQKHLNHYRQQNHLPLAWIHRFGRYGPSGR